MGKINNERKAYKKLLKKKHKEFINNLFVQLDSVQNSDPRGYMNLARTF